MTLLEALVSLVILGTAAAGFLGVFQGSARATQSADAWNRASTAAEAALEEAVRARIEGTDGAGMAGEVATAPDARVEVRPWSGTVDDIVVRVTLPDGRAITVHRLVRRR